MCCFIYSKTYLQLKDVTVSRRCLGTLGRRLVILGITQIAFLNTSYSIIPRIYRTALVGFITLS